MEEIKNRPHSIKRSFIMAVAVSLLAVALCSAATIYGCYRIQKNILPDSREIWLHAKITQSDGTVSEMSQRYLLDEPALMSTLIATDQPMQQENVSVEYTIEKIESSFSMLTPRKKTLYRAASVSMIAFPLLYSVIGIAACAWWFYRKKIAPPVQILSDATRHIAENDLDFEVTYAERNEFGELAEAFEKMRQALSDNNRQLWNMIEDRRTLQASIAHDLRNPISIIEGYVEHLQRNLANEEMNEEKLLRNLSYIAAASKRLERYTDYIRDLGAIEETDIHYDEVPLPDYLNDVSETFSVIGEQHQKRVISSCNVSACRVCLDKALIFRVLENVFVNALRYAEETIRLSFSLDQSILTVSILDDGSGFSEKLLRKKATLFFTEDQTGEHMGLGLATSRILSQKHGGDMTLSNIRPHGARVTVSFLVRV